MDESVVNELSQPNMPTFQEFHAKVLGESQQKRRQGEMVDEAGSPNGQDGASTTGVGGSSSGPSSNLSNQPRADEKSDHKVDVPQTQLPTAPSGNIIYPTSVTENGNGGGKKALPPSLRVMRNIAATECGAKLLQASPSAKHAHSILVNNNDEYMNQPCASDKWYVPYCVCLKDSTLSLPITHFHATE